MRYTDKVLLDLNKYIPNRMFLGPKITSRIVRDRKIKAYDILIDQRAFDSLPKKLIYKKINKDHFLLRLQGEKIAVSIMRCDIDTYLKHKPITIQSISLEVKQGMIDTDNIIDPLNNILGISKGYIGFNKCMDLDRDYYGLLKIVEYMASNKLKLDEDTKEYIKENRELVEKLDKSKVKNILFNILECKKSYYYFNYMDEELNILNLILPEIDTLKNVGKCKYHVVDTWTHSINTMKEIENIIYADGYFEKHLKRAYELHTGTIIGAHDRIKLLKLGALFHDIGKPRARWTDNTGRDRFRGHEIIGGDMVEEICERLHFTQEETSYLKKIVVNHMVTLVLYKTNDVSAKSLFDVFEKLKEDTMDIILIGLADIISTRRLLKPYEEMSIYKIHAEYLVNNYLIRYRKVLSLKDIISKKEIMDILDCDNGEIEYWMADIRRALFNGEIYLDRDKIREYLENRRK